MMGVPPKWTNKHDINLSFARFPTLRVAPSNGPASLVRPEEEPSGLAGLVQVSKHENHINNLRKLDQKWKLKQPKPLVHGKTWIFQATPPSTIIFIHFQSFSQVSHWYHFRISRDLITRHVHPLPKCLVPILSSPHESTVPGRVGVGFSPMARQ